MSCTRWRKVRTMHLVQTNLREPNPMQIQTPARCPSPVTLKELKVWGPCRLKRGKSELVATVPWLCRHTKTHTGVDSLSFMACKLDLKGNNKRLGFPKCGDPKRWHRLAVCKPHPDPPHIIFPPGLGGVGGGQGKLLQTWNSCSLLGDE